jgi:hypothetical protein
LLIFKGENLTQLPHLFPRLDKLLDCLGTGETRLLKAAFPMGFTVEIPDVLKA